MTATKPAVDHYTYRVSWSLEDGEHVATVAEFPSLSWLAAEASEALTGLLTLVREVVDDMVANGEDPPEALAERSYSGRFNLRLPPSVHRQLALDAAEQNVSLNQLVLTRLVSAGD